MPSQPCAASLRMKARFGAVSTSWVKCSVQGCITSSEWFSTRKRSTSSAKAISASPNSKSMGVSRLAGGYYPKRSVSQSPAVRAIPFGFEKLGSGSENPAESPFPASYDPRCRAAARDATLRQPPTRPGEEIAREEGTLGRARERVAPRGSPHLDRGPRARRGGLHRGARETGSRRPRRLAGALRAALRGRRQSRPDAGCPRRAPGARCLRLHDPLHAQLRP